MKRSEIKKLPVRDDAPEPGRDGLQRYQSRSCRAAGRHN